jgi:hypothetical protein
MTATMHRLAFPNSMTISVTRHGYLGSCFRTC